MKPELQRIKIAEACPSVFHVDYFSDGKTQVTWACNKNAHGPVESVDPLNDLNAMHEAEKVLSNEDWEYSYESYLAKITHRTIGDQRQPENFFRGARHRRLICSATAAQRAEAFLRTLDLWETP